MNKPVLIILVSLAALAASGCPGGHVYGRGGPNPYVLIVTQSGRSQNVEFNQKGIVTSYCEENKGYPSCKKSRDSPRANFRDLEKINSVSLLITSYACYRKGYSVGNNTPRTRIYGLGTLKNNGSEPIYILTEKPFPRSRLRDMFSKLYPEDDLWSGTFAGKRLSFGLFPYDDRDRLKKLRAGTDTARVNQIIKEYKRLYKPEGLSANTDFPGFTVVKPGETKPVISPSIGPGVLHGYIEEEEGEIDENL